MLYEVEISEHAEEQYDDILSYLAYHLMNPQAVENLIDDFNHAIDELESTPEGFEFCRSQRLIEMGFRKYHFSKHRYLFVYRINRNRVTIEGMYHELQDYENAIG